MSTARQLELPFPEQDTFEDKLKALLEHKALSKGYDGGKGQLWALCNDLPHPLGEIIYKVIRYHRQGNPDDLVKIAGWAKLIWQQQHAAAPQQPESRSTSRCT